MDFFLCRNYSENRILNLMMTECVQNEQEMKMMIKTLPLEEPTSDEKGARCTRREITVGLNAWTRGWDGVGCMRQHGVGTGWGLMIAGTGWVGIFLKIQRGWDGVGDKLCGNGWDEDHLITPCRPLVQNSIAAFCSGVDLSRLEKK